MNQKPRDDFDLFACPLPAIAPPSGPAPHTLRCHDCSRPSVTPLCAQCKHDSTRMRGEE